MILSVFWWKNFIIFQGFSKDSLRIFWRFPKDFLSVDKWISTNNSPSPPIMWMCANTLCVQRFFFLQFDTVLYNLNTGSQIIIKAFPTTDKVSKTLYLATNITCVRCFIFCQCKCRIPLGICAVFGYSIHATTSIPSLKKISN